MADFAPDAALAAYAQRAAQIMQSSQQAMLPGGGAVTRPAPAGALQIPRSFLGNSVNQLASLQHMNPNLLAALKQTPYSFTAGALAARNQLLAQQAASAAQDASGGNDINDFTRGFLPAGVGSDEAFRAHAQQYAPSYGGVTFAAHNIAQEGQVTYQNGQPGIMIKFTAPGQGSDTRWVPLS